MLTPEGILIVVDDFYPGPAAAGLTGGPVWQLLAPPESGGGDRQQRAWYDAPGAMRDTRSTSTKFGGLEKHLLVAFAPLAGAQTGVQPQPKHWEQESWATYQRAPFKGGERRTFLSTLLPHARATSAAALTARDGVRAEVAADGAVSVRVVAGVPGLEGRELKVTIAAGGVWVVTRSTAPAN